MEDSVMRSQKKHARKEILEVIRKGPDGKFKPVDLSLEGVNKWRTSVGLPPLTQLPQ